MGKKCQFKSNMSFWCLQRAQAALQAVNAVHTGSMTLGAIDPSGMAGPSPVLRVIVENLFYPVTLDVLHQVYTSSSSLQCCSFLT